MPSGQGWAASARCVATAARIAPDAVGNATKNESPSVRISTPPCSATAVRTISACRSSWRTNPSRPSSWSSSVDPSMSVNRNVTVPVGRSRIISTLRQRRGASGTQFADRFRPTCGEQARIGTGSARWCGSVPICHHGFQSEAGSCIRRCTARLARPVAAIPNSVRHWQQSTARQRGAGFSSVNTKLPDSAFEFVKLLQARTAQPARNPWLK